MTRDKMNVLISYEDETLTVNDVDTGESWCLWKLEKWYYRDEPNGAAKPVNAAPACVFKLAAAVLTLRRDALIGREGKPRQCGN